MAAAGDYEFGAFDPKDKSWWETREMGAPDDPYNQIAKIEKGSDEYEKYMTLAKETLDKLEKNAHTECKDNWESLGTQDGIDMHWRQNPDSPLLSFRGYGQIPASPEIIRLWLVQIDQRVYWDPTFIRGSYKFEITPETRIVTNEYSAPWPVSNRDFVSIGTEDLRDDGTFVTGLHSIEREDLPEQKGFVRGVLHNSGFVLRPKEKDGKPLTDVYYIATIDPKGWIPTMVVNLFNKQQPLNIVRLRELVCNVQTLIQAMFSYFFNIKEEAWTADNIKKAMTDALSNTGFSDKPDILFDAVRFYFMDKRVGPTDEELLKAMAAAGQVEVVKKLWGKFSGYLRCTGSSSEIGQQVEKFFKDRS